MSEGTVEQLDEWRQSVLSGWTDHRIVDDLWVDLHIWFFMHLYADLAKAGMVLNGMTFSEKYGSWLLVVKVSQDKVPLVAFVSGKNPTSCMRQCRDLLRNGGVNWTRDKYR